MKNLVYFFLLVFLMGGCKKESTCPYNNKGSLHISTTTNHSYILMIDGSYGIVDINTPLVVDSFPADTISLTYTVNEICNPPNQGRCSTRYETLIITECKKTTYLLQW